MLRTQRPAYAPGVLLEKGMRVSFTERNDFYGYTVTNVTSKFDTAGWRAGTTRLNTDPARGWVRIGDIPDGYDDRPVRGSRSSRTRFPRSSK